MIQTFFFYMKSAPSNCKFLSSLSFWMPRRIQMKMSTSWFCVTRKTMIIYTNKDITSPATKSVLISTVQYS